MKTLTNPSKTLTKEFYLWIAWENELSSEDEGKALVNKINEVHLKSAIDSYQSFTGRSAYEND